MGFPSLLRRNNYVEDAFDSKFSEMSAGANTQILRL
jgi:hypothetical protein